MRMIYCLLLILSLAACNLTNAPATEGVVIAVTVVSSNTPVATPTVQASNTPIATTAGSQPISCAAPTGWVTYTVQSGDTLFSIAQRASSTVNALVSANCLESANVLSAGQLLYVPQAVSAPPASSNKIVYWLPSENAINSNSLAIGCETYITPIETNTNASNDAVSNIRTALTALFNANPALPYHNYWSGGLSLDTITINSSGLVSIDISGNFLMSGTCGDPALIAQVLLIVFSEPEVLSARINVNGMNLKQMADMSGQSGANVTFTVSDIPLLNN